MSRTPGAVELPTFGAKPTSSLFLVCSGCTARRSFIADRTSFLEKAREFKGQHLGRTHVWSSCLQEHPCRAAAHLFQPCRGQQSVLCLGMVWVWVWLTLVTQTGLWGLNVSAPLEETWYDLIIQRLMLRVILLLHPSPHNLLKTSWVQSGPSSLTKAVPHLCLMAQCFSLPSHNHSCRGWHICKKGLTVADITKAEHVIIQHESSSEELKSIKSNCDLLQTSPPQKPQPVTDSEGEVGVGGARGEASSSCHHPADAALTGHMQKAVRKSRATDNRNHDPVILQHGCLF